MLDKKHIGVGQQSFDVISIDFVRYTFQRIGFSANPVAPHQTPLSGTLLSYL